MNACDSCVEETDSVLCEKCQDEVWVSASEIGRKEGAAVAFGLMGMAEAIRVNENIAGCGRCGRWHQDGLRNSTGGYVCADCLGWSPPNQCLRPANPFHKDPDT